VKQDNSQNLLNDRFNKNDPSTNFNKIVLEEFKALKQESLRLNQDIANTIWVGLSGFIVTIGASLILLNSNSIESFFTWIALILCLQALAAGSMFSFETQRYVRVGTYIRVKIEEHFFHGDGSNPYKNPLYWEHWIINKHSVWFYIISAAILQLPIIITAFLLFPEKFLRIFVPFFFKNSSFFLNLFNELHQYKLIFWVFLLITSLDITIKFYVFFSTRRELKDAGIEEKKYSTQNLIDGKLSNE